MFHTHVGKKSWYFEELDLPTLEQSVVSRFNCCFLVLACDIMWRVDPVALLFLWLNQVIFETEILIL